jgi:MIP family channel proteins
VAGGLFWTSYGKKCVSEFIGTYALVVAGPSSVILLPKLSLSSTPEGLVLVALTFGLTVSAIIILLGEHSGAVINPALALAAASARLLKGELLVPYILFQTAGGILGGLTLGLVFHSLGDSTNLGMTELAANISPMAGIALEALGTFTLAASALAATSWIRQSELQALVVGGTLTVLIVLIGPLTGAGFNPARSLGPALASDYFSNFYVYVIGPVVGALVAGLLFRRIRAPRRFPGLH